MWRLALLAAAGVLAGSMLVACGAAPETAATVPLADERSQPTTSAPEDEAEALFARVDLQPGELAALGLRIPSTSDVEIYVDRLVAGHRVAATTAERLADRFEQVIALRSPRWAIASYVRQAQVYEALVSSIAAALEAPHLPAFVLRDSTGQPLPLTPDMQAALQLRLQAAVRPLVEVTECRALNHYATARELSRLASIESFEATLAAARLSSYPEARVAACSR